jgi:hypothetical protein
MDTFRAIESEIQTAVLGGELPTRVFRRLLSKYPDTDRYDLGVLFRAAFPKVNGLVWNMVAHWRPSNLSDPHDMWVDVVLVHELIKAGYSVPWSADWPDLQWQKIKDVVVGSQPSASRPHNGP